MPIGGNLNIRTANGFGDFFAALLPLGGATIAVLDPNSIRSCFGTFLSSHHVMDMPTAYIAIFKGRQITV